MKKIKKDIIPSLLFRLFTGLLFLVSLYLVVEFIPHYQVAYYVLFTLITSLFLDVFHNNQMISSFFHKKETQLKISSHSLFLLGIFLSLAYIDTGIVFIAAAMTIIGTITGDVVRYYSFKNFPIKKEYQGFLITFIFTICAGFAFTNIFTIIIAMAFIAASIESLALFKEDYLLIPICASLAGQMILNFS